MHGLEQIVKQNEQARAEHEAAQNQPQPTETTTPVVVEQKPE